MTRELDIEIARLDGWKCSYDPTPLKGQPMGMFHCPECGQMVLAGMEHMVDEEDPYEFCPNYSTDLNALMALIRRRWPSHTTIYFSFLNGLEGHAELRIPGTGPVGRESYHSWEGDTDAERLAHAVKQALEAEA